MVLKLLHLAAIVVPLSALFQKQVQIVKTVSKTIVFKTCLRVLDIRLQKLPKLLFRFLSQLLESDLILFEVKIIVTFYIFCLTLGVCGVAVFLAYFTQKLFEKLARHLLLCRNVRECLVVFQHLNQIYHFFSLCLKRLLDTVLLKNETTLVERRA